MLIRILNAEYYLPISPWMFTHKKLLKKNLIKNEILNKWKNVSAKQKEIKFKVKTLLVIKIHTHSRYNFWEEINIEKKEQ